MKTLTIGDKALTLPERVRFTMGDRRRLRRDFGITHAEVATLVEAQAKPDAAEETLLKLVLFVAQKLDARVTEADVEALTYAEFMAACETLTPYLRALLQGEEGELDRPTSTPSTTSPSSTDGAPATSPS